MRPLEERIVSVDQGQDNWFKARAGRPTASQFSRIITTKGDDASNWLGYAAELVLESYKAGKNISPESGFQGNRHTERGNALEPFARDAFAERMGLEVVEVGFVLGPDEWAGCSPDGLVRMGPATDYIAGVEFKCPDNGAFASTLAHGMPSTHKQQVHGGMAITGLDYWYFATYQPNVPILIERVERDEYTEKVGDALNRFADFFVEVYPDLIAKLKGEEAV